MLKAMAGITDDTDGARYEPGDAVPAALVKRAPWLLDQGIVVDTKKASEPSQPEPVAPELDEDTVAAAPAAEEA